MRWYRAAQKPVHDNIKTITDTRGSWSASLQFHNVKISWCRGTGLCGTIFG